MNRLFAIIVLVAFAFVPTPSLAHSLWVLVPDGEDNVVKLWYSDSPEPGRASMIHRILKAKVYAVSPDSAPVAIPMKKIELDEETAEMSANLTNPAKMLATVCDIGVKESRRLKPASGSGVSQTSQAKESSSREHKEEPPIREWYFCKYVTSNAIKNKDADKAFEHLSYRLELIPRLEGSTLVIAAYLDGEPAKQLSVSITDVKGERQRLSTDENGIAKLDGVSKGRYAIRSKTLLDEAGKVNGKEYAKTALVSSLILDIE
ncbi:DUF4198 domain-containing protein [Bremerella sp. T1]|uniref:DUF4198 domain-containing protein n=1 Tax=Bremerella sp. TYQ1 TaxID=3119568 RepID=UPI001CCF5C39|nr:DUF4198 domain-containing protein [Bremerella volcania]UBM37041.1 DUF4198 domain-containing protein [Bremerella volcania]